MVAGEQDIGHRGRVADRAIGHRQQYIGIMQGGTQGRYARQFVADLAFGQVHGARLQRRDQERLLDDRLRPPQHADVAHGRQGQVQRVELAAKGLV